MLRCQAPSSCCLTLYMPRTVPRLAVNVSSTTHLWGSAPFGIRHAIWEGSVAMPMENMWSVVFVVPAISFLSHVLQAVASFHSLLTSRIIGTPSARWERSVAMQMECILSVASVATFPTQAFGVRKVQRLPHRPPVPSQRRQRSQHIGSLDARWACTAAMLTASTCSAAIVARASSSTSIAQARRCVTS